MPRSILITAGPTHEPIDAVRFIGNRSSGTLGMLLANEAAGRNWNTTLLLGPIAAQIEMDSSVRLRRFRTAADLGNLLAEDAPRADVVVMAAAVADYRPQNPHLDAKLRRTGDTMTIALEPTKDLLAACAARRRPGQVFVGFALEPEDELLASAQSKLRRKGVDMIVANPLATMDAPGIEAMLVTPEGVAARTDGVMPKEAFAGWLLDRLPERMKTEV